MALSDTTSQIPTTNDIDQDSLEYLFGRRRQAAPWVKIAREPEPVARISPEMVRLQAKVETFAAQIEMMLNQLHKANIELGYAKAQLSEKTEQLTLLAEYRAKAAFVVAAEAERTILKERIADLEMQLIEALEARADRSSLCSAPVPGSSPMVASDRIDDRVESTDVVRFAQTIADESAQPAYQPTAQLADAILRHTQQEPYQFHFDLTPVICALMVCFASLVLLTILI